MHARRPDACKKLTLGDVCFFLQEEWRTFESSRVHWTRERKALLSQVDELGTLARRQGGVIGLLERRIRMLEEALQHARSTGAGGADIAASGQTAPVSSSSGLVSGRAGSSGGVEDSPCSSKENEAPCAAECSANAPASPPLGQGGVSATCGDPEDNPGVARGSTGAACDAAARPLGRKSAQRSLVFGGGKKQASGAAHAADGSASAAAPPGQLTPPPGVPRMPPPPSRTRAAAASNRWASREHPVAAAAARWAAVRVAARSGCGGMWGLARGTRCSHTVRC
ncbi:hypothetical protein WJX81_003151 [Elliptochloris bilobata]|uniref:Striatin N-terminal domain-containing protein n=1 Tax=Elliptochloris bilobata TaxID=381761 RepID=A0AAW1QN77_9CHLO